MPTVTKSPERASFAARRRTLRKPAGLATWWSDGRMASTPSGSAAPMTQVATPMAGAVLRAPGSTRVFLGGRPRTMRRAADDIGLPKRGQSLQPRQRLHQQGLSRSQREKLLGTARTRERPEARP